MARNLELPSLHTQLPYRTSELACVVIRLRIDERPHLLMRAHRAWKDWSFVGGHVEADESEDWLRAACRETEEEMAPLRCGLDVEVAPLALPASVWGPVASRSSGKLTIYRAAWYHLRFLRDPALCLAALPSERFLLLDEENLRRRPRSRDISGLVAQLERVAPRGLDELPFAWPESCTRISMPVACPSLAPLSEVASPCGALANPNAGG